MDLSSQDGTGAGSALPERKLRALLLRRLPAAEAARLEERLILEDGLAERLREAEHELLEAYAGGRLSRRDRRAVACYLLRTAGDRERLRFAGALRRLAREQAPARVSLLQRILQAWSTPRLAGLLAAGLAAAAIVLLAGRLLESGQSAPHLAVSAPAGPLAGAVPVYTISLLAGLTRGAPAPPIHIPPGTAPLRLQAEVEDAALPPYRLQVFDEQGKLLASFDRLGLQHAGRHAYVEVTLAAAALGPGRRHITLQPQAGGAASAAWDIQID